MKTETQFHTPEALALLRRAATLGPGHRGQRRESTADERAEVQRQMASAKVDPPAFLKQETEWIDLRAKLFEAGDYPDKGVKVSPGDLQRLESSFDLPVPILIEHANSPLQIGYLTDVRAAGSELFGTVALTKQANELIDASGAHALSLGLDPTLQEILEVSLVKTPRVASARLFTGEFLSDEVDWKARYEQLRTQLDSQEPGRRIEELVKKGKLLPAQVPFARALASSQENVGFDGESVPVSRLVLSLLECAPPHRLFGERAPSGASLGSHFDPDHRAFYDRYFAGLSLEEIAKNRVPPTTNT